MANANGWPVLILGFLCALGPLFIITAFLLYPMGDEPIIEGTCVIVNKTLYESHHVGDGMPILYAPIFSVNFLAKDGSESLTAMAATSGNYLQFYHRKEATLLLDFYGLGFAYECIHGDDPLAFSLVNSTSITDEFILIGAKKGEIKGRFFALIIIGAIISLFDIISCAYITFSD
jgi:hypothetical protein